MLEVDDLKDVLEQLEKTVGDMSLSDKAYLAEQQLHICAEKRNLVLELRITDAPWFQ